MTPIVSREAMFYAPPADRTASAQPMAERQHGTGRQYLRDYVPGGSGKCSRCGEDSDTSGRYCKPCRAAYMRSYRLGVGQRYRRSGTGGGRA